MESQPQSSPNRNALYLCAPVNALVEGIYEEKVSWGEIKRHGNFGLDMIQHLLPSPNLFYALRMEGVFTYMKTRSVPKQENYRPLAEVAKDQPVFEFQNVSGILAGFFTPSFMSSLNVPGLHLHFLSADLTCGGHVLECRPRQGRIGVQFITRLELSLPITSDYLTQDFTRNIEQDLNKAEQLRIKYSVSYQNRKHN